MTSVNSLSSHKVTAPLLSYVGEKNIEELRYHIFTTFATPNCPAYIEGLQAFADSKQENERGLCDVQESFHKRLRQSVGLSIGNYRPVEIIQFDPQLFNQLLDAIVVARKEKLLDA